YSFSDMNTFRGISQYRLQQVDLDGRYRYSDIRTTRTEEATSRMLLYPNPARGVANLQFADAQTARDVMVTDMNGRVVKQWRNVSTQVLQLNDLTPGVYTVRVIDQRSGSQDTERLVVSGR
ncbi:MAG: T9SS type A sorting domain-containing protein, partial [Proteobacteria bacterium]